MFFPCFMRWGFFLKVERLEGRLGWGREPCHSPINLANELRDVSLGSYSTRTEGAILARHHVTTNDEGVAMGFASSLAIFEAEDPEGYSRVGLLKYDGGPQCDSRVV